MLPCVTYVDIEGNEHWLGPDVDIATYGRSVDTMVMRACSGHAITWSFDIHGRTAKNLAAEKNLAQELDVDDEMVFYVTRKHRRWYAKNWDQSRVTDCILQLIPDKEPSVF